MPFHSSASAPWPRSSPPTAKQRVMAGQDTPHSDSLVLVGGRGPPRRGRSTVRPAGRNRRRRQRRTCSTPRRRPRSGRRSCRRRRGRAQLGPALAVPALDEHRPAAALRRVLADREIVGGRRAGDREQLSGRVPPRPSPPTSVCRSIPRRALGAAGLRLGLADRHADVVGGAVHAASRTLTLTAGWARDPDPGPAVPVVALKLGGCDRGVHAHGDAPRDRPAVKRLEYRGSNLGPGRGRDGGGPRRQYGDCDDRREDGRATRAAANASPARPP